MAEYLTALGRRRSVARHIRANLGTYRRYAERKITGFGRIIRYPIQPERDNVAAGMTKPRNQITPDPYAFVMIKSYSVLFVK